MTELSRFQKDVEVAASALEMRAENEDAREEAIHLTGNSEVQNRNRCGWQLHCGDIFWRKVWRKRSVRITERT